MGCACVLSHVRLFVTPWTVVHQAPLSMKFSKQEYWSGLPFPAPGDLSDLGIEPASPALQVDSLPLSHQGSPLIKMDCWFCCSVAESYPTPCNPVDCSTPDFPAVHRLLSLLKLMSIVSDAIEPPHPLSLPSHPASVFPSIRVFSNESALCIRWPKYWSFSFSINPSNEYSELISFRIDWFDLLAVQEALKSFLQHHNSDINSLTLSLLYGPAFTCIYNYWENHRFDYTDLCWQNNVSAF